MSAFQVDSCAFLQLDTYHTSQSFPFMTWLAIGKLKAQFSAKVKK